MARDQNRQSELSDLDWLAFQYLLHELPGSEAAEFESQLRDSPKAQQALAQAVSMVRDLASGRDGESTAVGPNVMVMEGSTPFRNSALSNKVGNRHSMTAWGMLAVSILIVGLTWWGYSYQGATLDREGEQLAEAWYARVSDSSEGEVVFAVASELMMADDSVTDSDESWLMAAVISLDGEAKELIQ